jgi:mono/diheme cytochrome c family protein
MNGWRLVRRAQFIALLLVACGALHVSTAQQAQQSSGAAAQRELIDQYCVTCHSDKAKTGDLSLQSLDLTKLGDHGETWEKVIRKLRAGAMPPPGAKRPEGTALRDLASFLENSIDKAALAKPDPGRATLTRLNRAEYGNAVRDLLGLEIDPAQYIPPDDQSFGFDNIADILRTTPPLMQRYISASWNLSRLAVGNPAISPVASTYRASPDLSQDVRLKDMPFGTRGGLKATHNFALDGEYEIKVRLWRVTADIIRGLEEPHQIEVSIDGARVGFVTFGGPADRDKSYENPGLSASDIDRRLTFRVKAKAGPHEVIATFPVKSEILNDGVLQPFLRANIDPLGYRGLPAVDRITIAGPYNASGATDTPSRRKIFICKPSAAGEELGCARKILSTLATKAYRRPVSDAQLKPLVDMYQNSRKEGDFGSGVEAAIQLLLASPEFLFRLEPDPANVPPGGVYRLDDLALASRLSFFLWSTLPDEELIKVASEGRLREPAVLERQTKRMLEDPRSKALVQNFAAQWLYLRNLKNTNPEVELFPDFDDNLRQAMRQETELFFESVLREDRSFLALFDANYTFLNERLARHYGISGIYGSDFRRVTLNDTNRGGLLGQASILTVTSLPTRTSPVMRGKWILTNLLGMEPHPPPPAVEGLKENTPAEKPKSLRERLEAHQTSTVCKSCHRVMDPIGLSLENFDAVGRWRTKDDGVPVDPTGTLFDGTTLKGPADLKRALTSRQDVIVTVFVERLMTYALGRGVTHQDMPFVRQVVQSAAPSKYRLSSIVMSIIKSTPFQMKKKPETVNTSASR